MRRHKGDLRRGTGIEEQRMESKERTDIENSIECREIEKSRGSGEQRGQRKRRDYR
jgi:hypothetical protein